MWTRLVALILVPLAGIALVAAPSLAERRAVVEGSQVTEQQVASLNSLLELRYALVAELIPTEVLVRANDFGLDAKWASQLMGFDVSSRVSSGRASVDESLAALAIRSDSIAHRIAGVVGAERAEVDAGTADADAIHGALTGAMDELSTAATSELATIVTRAETSSWQGQGVEAATHRLVHTFEFVRSGSAEVESLFQLALLAPASDQPRLRDELVGLRALYRRGLADIKDEDSPAIRSMVASIETNPDVAMFDSAVDGAIAKTGVRAMDLAEVAVALRSSFARLDLFRDLLRIATGEATGLAHMRQLEAGDRLRDEVLTIIGVVILTLLAAIAIAWSMTRRLAQAWHEGERLQHRLTHQADHDLLTGLPNRKAAIEALDLALARAHRHGEITAVLFLDLDGFKRANDDHGHHVGDLVLRACADRLNANSRAGDFLARLGGDEFLVIAERIGSVREGAELAERLILAISEPIEFDGITARVGASIGMAASLDSTATGSDLLRDADNAVHRAKQLGKGRVEIFDEHAREELATQSDLEHALRHALATGGLRLHYQPVTDTLTGRLCGFEALARWQRGDENVRPDVFIPVAEQSDLINHIGRWALGEATAQLATWTELGLFEDAYVAVNISGRHLLGNSLIDDVREALTASALDPARLIVEITETVIVNDTITAVAHLQALRTLGIRVALDDFGTGYTSIGQLWRLPVDILKIDGSFISQLEAKQDHVIVEMMIEVAHTLGLSLIAEGVETEAQHATLRELSCDAIQGYLIARPQAPDQLVVTAQNGMFSSAVS